MTTVCGTRLMEGTQHIHPETDPGGAFRVDGLRVDPSAGRISGPGADELVDPKVMEVFVALARRPGEYVTREVLLDAVWPDRVVTDNVLSRCIYQLRKHLVRAGGSRKYKALLETLPKRGYRLNAEVLPDHPTAESVPKPKAAGWRKVGLLAALLAVVAAWWAWDRAGDGRAPEVHAHVPVSIAVLPFVDLSPEADQEYFADGISEELINALTRIPELRVIARSSSFWFKGQDPDIATVAEKLNVTHVLEGSVRRSDDRVRISAQLIDAADSLHLWSETFDREFGDIFAIQDEIALAVAENLELAFGGDDPGQATHSPDPEAHALNLHAWFLFNRRLPGDLEHAEVYYRRALEIDPEYAAAWAGLGGVYDIQAALGDRDFKNGLALAREAAERAVELEPTLPEARARLSSILIGMGEREAAEMHMKKAVEYGANSPLVLGMEAGRRFYRGQHEKAIELHRRAAGLDPMNAVIRNNLAGQLLTAGRLEEARLETLVSQAIKPDSDSIRRIGSLRLVEIHVQQRDPAEALALIADWRGGPERDFALALIHSIDGQLELTDAAVDRLAAEVDLWSAIALAEVFALRGETDAAFDWLDTAYHAVEHGQVESTILIGSTLSRLWLSSFLQPLHEDPRWQGWLLDPMRELLAQPPDG